MDILDESKQLAKDGGVVKKTGVFYESGGKTSDLVKGYLGIGEGNSITKGQRMARYGTVGGTAGVGVGVALAKRYKSGGTLTRDAEGKRDIAGIPFL